MPELTMTTLVPIGASDFERGEIELDFAAFVTNLRESGKDPVVGVETTSAGDVLIVTVEGEPVEVEPL